MSKTFDQKRLLELAGLKESKPRPSKINLQESFGNAFIQTLLLEEEEEKEEQGEEKEEEDKSAETEEGSGKTEEEAEEDGDLGDEEDPSLSDAELAKGLKDGAQAMADAVPSKSNEDFATIINSVKDTADDAQKLKKIADYIGSL
jgi:hypothetical protein